MSRCILDTAVLVFSSISDVGGPLAHEIIISSVSVLSSETVTCS